MLAKRWGFSVGFENTIALAFYRVMFRHPWKLQLGKVFVLPVAYGADKNLPCFAALFLTAPYATGSIGIAIAGSRLRVGPGIDSGQPIFWY